MKFKEYDKVKTLVEKDGYPPSTIGIIVSFYPNSDLCEVEIWDKDEYPIDVVTYDVNELEKI
ncbi:MAG: hypothetical protein Q4D95_06090 [Peptoniphilus sp.]|nr:hypothetical protein [Peptoniphilus sp.]